MPDDYHAYGCIMYFPQHPAADMHGLVRAIVNSRTQLEAHKVFADCLARAGVRSPLKPHGWSKVSRCQFIAETQSHIEREVLRNTQDAVYLCQLSVMYLNCSVYQPMRYKLPRLARRLAKRAIKPPVDSKREHWSQDPVTGTHSP